MNERDNDIKTMLERRAADVAGAAVDRHAVMQRSRRRRAALPVLVAGGLLAVGTLGAGALDDGNTAAPFEPASSPTAATFPGHPGEMQLGDDPSTKDRVEIARGEYDGAPWTLYIRPDYRDEDRWCDGFKWGGSDGSGCPTELREGEHLKLGQGWDGTSISSIRGEISRDVARVEVRLTGYEPFEVPTISGPDDPGVNFFVAFAPSESRGTVAVFDSSGELLQESELMENILGDRFNDEGVVIQSDEFGGPDEPKGPKCIAEAITIEGTDGPDVLEGTPGSDVIAGLGGDDVIAGLGGDDVICGGPGNDRIDGGPGFDEIAGEAGDDELVGGDGFDTVAYWNSPDGVRLDFTAGTATGEGIDSIAGFEELGGSKHDDVLIGGDGDDQFQGNGGNDTLVGNGGDDLFYAGLGDDNFDGGPGRDAIVFDDEGGVNVDLAFGTATGHGNDTIASVEVIHGSDDDDTIRGSDADEVLVGRAGNDVISGGSGDDILWGDHLRLRAGGLRLERADDSLDGGDGADEYHGGPGENSCTPPDGPGDTYEDC